MSVRSNILSAIETALSAIAGIGDVSVGKLKEVDLDDLTLPAVFSDFGDDRVADGPAGFETFAVPLEVEIWCKDTDRESLIASVHTALLADVTQGNNALNTTRKACRLMFIDPGRSLSGFILSFEILYRHPIGAP